MTCWLPLLLIEYILGPTSQVEMYVIFILLWITTATDICSPYQLLASHGGDLAVEVACKLYMHVAGMKIDINTISGICRGVDEIFTLFGCYAVLIDSLLPIGTA